MLWPLECYVTNTIWNSQILGNRLKRLEVEKEDEENDKKNNDEDDDEKEKIRLSVSVSFVCFCWIKLSEQLRW